MMGLIRYIFLSIHPQTGYFNSCLLFWFWFRFGSVWFFGSGVETAFFVCIMRAGSGFGGIYLCYSL
jgi:hypothetical protein